MTASSICSFSQSVNNGGTNEAAFCGFSLEQNLEEYSNVSVGWNTCKMFQALCSTDRLGVPWGVPILKSGCSLYLQELGELYNWSQKSYSRVHFENAVLALNIYNIKHL